MKKAIFTVLGLISLVITSPISAQEGPEVEAGGWIKAAVQTQPQVEADHWPFSGLTTGIKTVAFWGDWLTRMTLEASGDFSGALEATVDSKVDSPAPLTWRYNLGNYSRGVADLKELYLEYTSGDLLVRGGKQIFTWGLADGNNPTDALNPRWVGTRFTTTLDEQKIAVPGILAEYSLPDNLGKVEAVFLPLAVPNVLPEVSFDQVVFAGFPGPFPPQTPGQRVIIQKAELPAFSGENLEGGLRSLIYLENFTFSFSYLTQLDKYFDLVVSNTFIPGTLGVTPPMNITTQTPVYNRIHQIGVDFATTFAGLELRGEGAFVLTKDLEGTDLYTKNPSLKAVVQLSRSWMDGMVSTSLSWAPTYVVDHKFWEQYSTAEKQGAYQMAQRNGQAYGWENAVGARLGLTLVNETLKPDALFLVNAAAREYLGTLGATWNFADGWNLKVGSSLYGTFIPEDTARELGVFGNSVTDKKDGAYVELRWDF